MTRKPPRCPICHERRPLTHLRRIGDRPGLGSFVAVCADCRE